MSAVTVLVLFAVSFVFSALSSIPYLEEASVWQVGWFCFLSRYPIDVSESEVRDVPPSSADSTPVIFKGFTGGPL